MSTVAALRFQLLLTRPAPEQIRECRDAGLGPPMASTKLRDRLNVGQGLIRFGVILRVGGIGEGGVVAIVTKSVCLSTQGHHQR